MANPHSIDVTIGIDLGTTTTALAYKQGDSAIVTYSNWEGHDPSRVHDAYTREVVPTRISYDADGEIHSWGNTVGTPWVNNGFKVYRQLVDETFGDCDLDDDERELLMRLWFTWRSRRTEDWQLQDLPGRPLQEKIARQCGNWAEIVRRQVTDVAIAAIKAEVAEYCEAAAKGLLSLQQTYPHRQGADDDADFPAVMLSMPWPDARQAMVDRQVAAAPIGERLRAVLDSPRTRVKLVGGQGYDPNLTAALQELCSGQGYAFSSASCRSTVASGLVQLAAATGPQHEVKSQHTYRVLGNLRVSVPAEGVTHLEADDTLSRDTLTSTDGWRMVRPSIILRAGEPHRLGMTVTCPSHWVALRPGSRRVYVPEVIRLFRVDGAPEGDEPPVDVVRAWDSRTARPVVNVPLREAKDIPNSCIQPFPGCHPAVYHVEYAVEVTVYVNRLHVAVVLVDTGEVWGEKSLHVAIDQL